MKDEIITACVGESAAVVGTATQSNQYLQTISLIITIIGGVLTIIATCIVPLIKWFKEAKKDGKIDKEEIKEGKNLFIKLIEAVKNFFSKFKKKGD